MKPQLVYQLFNESALCLSLDRINQIPVNENGLLLTIGSNTKVVVLAKRDNGFAELTKISKTSDNVSNCKSVYVSESKKTMVVYSTYDARIAYQLF